MWDSIMRSILASLKNRISNRQKEKQKKLKVHIDPSGYVFEAVEGNRVSGVTAEVYEGASSTAALSFGTGRGGPAR
jgi:hypothetical protein